MLLQTVVSSFSDAIEQALRDILATDSSLDSEYLHMLHYHMGWTNSDQLLYSAGKRTRPLLTLLCTAAAGGDQRLAIPLAAGVELIHNFSLIHDDIQDNSQLRRSRPTVWARFGRNQAINAGDALFTYAHLALQQDVGLTTKTRLEALRILDETCISLTKGQHLDMAFETQELVSTKEYMSMISGKTAALISAATEFGALAAGAQDNVRLHYRAYGHYLGLAFQIRDDILGIWGDSAETGKSSATDIERGKKTLPILYGLRQSSELRELYRKDDLNTDTVRNILDEKGARKYCEDKEQLHAQDALQHLAAADPLGDAGASLENMTLQLLGRGD